jgi:hypothetical protein
MGSFHTATSISKTYMLEDGNIASLRKIYTETSPDLSTNDRGTICCAITVSKEILLGTFVSLVLKCSLVRLLRLPHLYESSKQFPEKSSRNSHRNF